MDGAKQTGMADPPEVQLRPGRFTVGGREPHNGGPIGMGCVEGFLEGDDIAGARQTTQPAVWPRQGGKVG